MTQGFTPQWPTQPGWAGPAPARGPGPSWGAPTGPAPSPPPRRRSLGPVILAALIVVGVIMLGLIVYSLTSQSQPPFQNDDYVPPAPGTGSPLPRLAGTDPEAILTSNSLYAQTVPRPVRCEPSNPDLDIDAASDAEVTTYIDEIIACNMRVWNPPFEGTGEYELVRPVVNVYGDSVTTPCGGGRAMGPNASYCGANQEVYWSRVITRHLPALSAPHAVDMVMSHEFGHAIQARTVILQATGYSQQSLSRSEALELHRRLELQADCFAGLWVQSVAESMSYSSNDITNLIAAMAQVGDRPGTEGDHGQSQSRTYWIQVGMSGDDVGRCNTYIAESDLVR